MLEIVTVGFSGDYRRLGIAGVFGQDPTNMFGCGRTVNVGVRPHEGEMNEIRIKYEQYKNEMLIKIPTKTA